MKRKKTIRNIRLIGRIGVILAAVVLTTGALLYFIHDSVSAAWFDDNWSHRLKYTFTNTGSAVSNQKVKFDIDTATLITDGKLQSDCGDSRFTDANGIVLQYYLDSSGGACNGASTDYYVLVPTIGVGTTTIYHYYGNPSASNGTEAAQFSQSTFSPNSGPTGGSEENGPAPVAYWKFDEGQGSTAYDLSNNSFDGTLGTGSSAPSWLTEDQCISGKCLRFDGDQDYINVGDTSKLEFGNADSEFSISGWIRLNEVPDDSPAMIISKYNSNSSNREWYFSVNDSLQPLIYMSEDGQNTNTRIETSDTAITVGTWYHLAATVNVSTDVHTLYIDGNEVSTTDAGSDITTIQTGTAEVHIGAVARSSTTPDNLFPGELDEIKVYPYARTADEIKQDFASRGSVHGTSAAFGYSDLGKKLSVGLVGHWKMDESAANGCTGGTNDSCDSSGNGNDGAWTGNATITTGKFDNGVTFDGTGDYISYSDVSSFDKASNENKTISLWVFPDTTPSTNAQVLLVKRDETSPNDGYEMTYRTDRTISLQFDDGPTSSSITTNTSIAEDQWSHITYVIDSSTDTISAYINGIFDKSSTNDSFSNDASNSDNFQIANDYRDASNLDNFDGQIDETRIYNRALTPAEIQTLYNFAPGPLAYWRLDDGKGSTTVTDVSGNASSLVQKSMSPDSSWTPGKLGGGLDFDGTNDYICYDSDGNGTCDSATPLQLLGNMSFGTWVKADAIDDGDVIVQVADFTENQADNTTYQVRFTGTAGDLEYNHEHSSGT
ncbi:DUF2341 domain-containing protein, partial [Candidatus Roizmanbacteria bacterium]|nr:DUF2341 domain-containing protein [Candidatus Roizmanbacteria bacterium]